MSPEKLDRLLRTKEVQEMLGVKNTLFWEMVSDGRFPQPIILGERARAWRLSEVEAWIESRPRRGSDEDKKEATHGRS